MYRRRNPKDYQDSCELVGDSLGFLAIPGDSLGFLGIPWGSLGFLGIPNLDFAGRVGLNGYSVLLYI